MKVSIIGQKNTVLLIAQHICRLKEVKELVLVDDVHRISSLALAELKRVACIGRSDVHLITSRNPSVVTGSEVLVYCPFDFSQLSESPQAGYLRSFEFENKDQFGSVFQHAPEAKIVVAAYPSANIVQSVHQNNNMNLGQVIGVSGHLVNTDLKIGISEAVEVSVEDVVSMIIGNDDEYYMLSQYCCAGGIPIDQLLSQSQVVKLDSAVRNQPKKLIFPDFVHTISILTAQVVNTILLDKKRIIVAATVVEADDMEVCLNLPVKVGRNGAEKLTSLPLTNKQFEQFVELIKKTATQRSNL